MTLKIPGKVLVIDNRYEDVRDIITSLWRDGQGIVFLDTLPSEEAIPSNVRLIILDLMLREDGDIQPEDYEQAALALYRISKRTSFFLVAVWSIHVDPQDVEQASQVVDTLKRAYRDVAGSEFSTSFFKPFGKNIGQQQLEQEIQGWVVSNPQAGLVFKWEDAVEDSRDGAVSKLVDIGGIDAIVRSMAQELGEQAVPREMLNLLNRILVRHASKEDRVRTLSPLVSSILTGGTVALPSYEWYARFHHLQTYFPVHESEPLWTGDILKRTSSGGPLEEFAIVITPACDLAQKRPTGIKVAYGIQFDRIPEYAVDDENVPAIAKLFGKTIKGKYKKRGVIIKSLATGSDLPERFKVLYFLKTSPDAGNYFHVLFDFSRIDSLPCERHGSGNFGVPQGWQRLCRLDSPYIEDLLQKYSTFSSRVGTPSIPETIKGEMERKIKTTS